MGTAYVGEKGQQAQGACFLPRAEKGGSQSWLGGVEGGRQAEAGANAARTAKELSHGSKKRTERGVAGGNCPEVKLADGPSNLRPRALQ